MCEIMRRINNNLGLLWSVLVWGVMVVMSVSAVAESEGPLVVHSAWVPQAPPNIGVMAGYMSVVNVSSDPIVIAGLSSSAYKEVQMHQSLVEDGISTMAEVKSVVVGPGARIEFSPGGLHLMLIAPVSTDNSADTVPMMLHLADGGWIHFTLDIVAKTARPEVDVSDAHDHSMHAHHGS